jgi:hypothetical protein
MPAEGGAPQVLARGLGTPALLTVRGAWLAFANSADGSIWKLPSAGGAPLRVAAAQAGLVALALDGEDVYWATGVAPVPDGAGGDGYLWRSGANGASPLQLIRTGFPTALALGPRRLYWASIGSAYRTRATGAIFTAGAIHSMRKRGGAVETVAEIAVSPNAIAVDPTGVYWSSSEGSVDWQPVGRVARRLAEGEPSPRLVAVRGEDVIWVNKPAEGAFSKQGSTLRRLAKSEFIESPLIRSATWSALEEARASAADNNLECRSGFADCDRDPSNGCEANLGDSPHHCGACGHDCLGEHCTEGVCNLFSSSSLPPVAFAIAAGKIYWSQLSGGIFAVALNEPAHPWPPRGIPWRPEQQLVEGTSKALLAASADRLFWIEAEPSAGHGGALFTADLAGKHRQRLATTGWPLGGLVLAKDQLLWSDLEGKLWGLALQAGAQPVALAPIGGTAAALTTEGVFAYWLDTKLGALVRFDLASRSAQTVIAGLVDPSSLFIDGPDAYVGEGSSDRPGRGRLSKVSLATGQSSELAHGLTRPCAIVADERDLYYLDCDGNSPSIWKLPKNGEPASEILDRTAHNCFPPMVQTKSAVYLGCERLAGFAK